MGYFWLKRLHSLSGIFLAIFFALALLLPYSSIFGGPESFDLFSLIIARLPVVGSLCFIFIAILFIFHALTGLHSIYSSDINVISYGTYGNWIYALMRFTGLLIIPFAAYHIFKTSLPFAFTDRYADYIYMRSMLSPGWVKIFYFAGVAAIAFHAGNGISLALMKWGVTVSRRAQEVTAMIAWVIVIVLATWGFLIVNAF